MKVIFLDIDGVLNSRQFFMALYRETGKSILVREFCPISVSNLLYIIAEVPGVKIVVSSSWRKGTTIEELRRTLEKNAFIPPDMVIDKTADYSDRGHDRGWEIQDWLDKHPEVEKFVILDDSDDVVHLKPFRPDIKWDLGLTVLNSDAAIKILDPRTHCKVCLKDHAGGYPVVCTECLNKQLKEERENK